MEHMARAACGMKNVSRSELTFLVLSGFAECQVAVFDTLVDLMHGDSEELRLTAFQLFGLLSQTAASTSSTSLAPLPGLCSRVTNAICRSVLSVRT